MHLLLSQNINGCIPEAELAYTNRLIALLTQLNHQITTLISQYCVIVRPTLNDILNYTRIGCKHIVFVLMIITL